MSHNIDVLMPDASAANITLLTQKELDEKHPNRPRNHSKTLPFHELFLNLFNLLNENKKKPTGPSTSRNRVGKHGPLNLSPHELRRSIIERFISRWRNEVGDDIYPAFRLIIPDKDRERPMYGLKEKAIGKLLVKVMRINKDSEDGYDLLNWKLPGHSMASRMAGDFAGRCFEVISKRPMRTDVGDMTIEEVNSLLDRLCMEQKEEGQIPIFEQFYTRMNPDEMLWLIRIILRQMKVGATERTFFDVWHPDASSLFNVSSSLRRVCWELYDPKIRLEGDDRGIALMQCFQPQLAQFQMHSFQKMVEKMRPTEDDDVFWIEEKLDGERMQLHMTNDDTVSGGKRFAFWSRKAKEYTYLYGNGFFDHNSALTRHLVHAFHEGVENIILDGEMITWDLEQDSMVPFGTLKTAALWAQRNPFSTTGQRPLYRVFDILYLNGKSLTNYTLRDRRKALEAAVKSVPRLFEVHSYEEAHSALEIEPLLRKVVAEASEGLVLKNPRSAYRLNDRNDDWMKVKPEYMTEFGESLDCIVIGGYYGSGHRGGRLSSFLCGLRVDENHVSQGANPMKCYSFFKVGGGMTASDYANIRHKTDGKWKDWDPKRPPLEYVELGGGSLQYERPDLWIRPDESVVVEVKAASVHMTDTFRMGFTLRFPRFTRLRDDKDWKSALSMQEFSNLKAGVEQEQKQKAFEVDNSRRKRLKITKKKVLTIAGAEALARPYGGEISSVFSGMNFYIMSEALHPVKKSKPELEQLVKAHGGSIFQSHSAAPHTLCIADKRVVKVAALIKSAPNTNDIIRPSWLLACIDQAVADKDRKNDTDHSILQYILPPEPAHMFHTTPSSLPRIKSAVDSFGDSYARDTSPDELKALLFSAAAQLEDCSVSFELEAFRADLAARGRSLLVGNTQEGEHHQGRTWLFAGLKFWFDWWDPVSSVWASDSSSLDSPDSKYSKEEKGEGESYRGGESTVRLSNLRRLRLYQARVMAEFAGAEIAERLDTDLQSDGDDSKKIPGDVERQDGEGGAARDGEGRDQVDKNGDGNGCNQKDERSADGASVGITHIIVGSSDGAGHAAAESLRARLKYLRKRLAERKDPKGLPRTVGVGWMERCWAEGTRVDEERFASLGV